MTYYFAIDRQQWRNRDTGRTSRLIKHTFKSPLQPGTVLELLDARNAALDAERVHPETAYPWTCGFWVPERALRGALRLRVISPSGESSTSTVRCGKGPAGALPHSPEKDLDSYLSHRERAIGRWPGVEQGFRVSAYLRKHDILFEKPARHWTEGLYLGNGILGGVVTGGPKGRLSLGLDRADIWLATEREHPLGRGYACDLHLDCGAFRRFAQRLSLGRGVVTTTQDDLTIVAYIDREHSVAVIELCARSPRKIGITLTRRELPLLSESVVSLWNGSWARIATRGDVARYRAELRKCPRAPMIVQGANLTCLAPNLSVTGTLAGDLRVEEGAARNAVRGTLRLLPGKTARLTVAVSVASPGEEAASLRRNSRNVRRALHSTLERHTKRWEEFWQRSFLQMPDPLQENLYYQGLYHMACSFAGNSAPGFFGLTQPIDHRTWLDCHVTDAQTEMLTWGAYASNHLALTAPLLSTYAECWKEHAEHTAGAGAKAPHWFVPIEGGGHAMLAPPFVHPYPFGSTAWHVLDFWWDYLYSGDKRFLARVAYPILRSAAEAIAATMTLRGGVYHCLHSGSPEQEKTASDNVYDRVSVEALLKAVISASTILRVDEAERRRFKSVLARLFPLPGDGKTIFETLSNPHPYRCHPVVLMGLYPLGLWRKGMKEYEMAQRTFDLVTNLFAFHYEDRHKTIVGHEGGIEPNGHATSFLLAFAARLRRPRDFDRLFASLVLGRQLKRNGLRSICDPRHSLFLERMGIIEASSGQTAALAERLLQSFPDHIDVFPCVGEGAPCRFAGMRAMGGFLLSGEWTGSQVSFIAVQSLNGGILDLRAPWRPEAPVWMKRGGKVSRAAGPVRMKPGETVILSQERGGLKARRWPARTEPAAKPVAIPVRLTDPHRPDILYYPEDLPHGQETENGYLFLGNPRRAPTPLPSVWSEADALGHVTDPDWRLRQTAARVLGRVGTPRAREALCRLVKDPSSVVAATAAVGLVAHRQSSSDALLRRALKKIPSLYVRNEAVKAFSRREKK